MNLLGNLPTAQYDIQWRIAVLILIGGILIGCATVEHDWNEVSRSDTINAYSRFLREHPQGEYAVKARARIDELRWSQVRTQNTIVGYEDFVKKYPNSLYRAEAEQAINKAKEESLWSNAVKHGNDVALFRSYLQQYPSGRYAAEATDHVDYALAESEGTAESYSSYIEKHPNSVHSGRTKKIVAMIGTQPADAQAFKASLTFLLRSTATAIKNARAPEYLGKVRGLFPQEVTLEGKPFARIETEDGKGTFYEGAHFREELADVALVYELKNGKWRVVKVHSKVYIEKKKK